MKAVALLWAIASASVAFASETKEPPFPPGTKLMPAQKVQLILNEKEFADLDYPSRPCVLNDLVNVIPGEEIAIEAEVRDGKLVNLHPVDGHTNPKNPIRLQFTQNQDRASPFMVLKVTNPFGKGLAYEASIQIYGREGMFKTSTVVVAPKLVSFESWPQPLTRILLKNFQLVEPEGQAAIKSAPQNAVRH